MPPANQSGALRIVVIEGEDAVNIVQQKTAVAPVVEVRDRNDQPVAGAIVRFAIREGRGTFAGARTLSVTTNAAGRAVATGLTPTGSGALQIGASATFQGQTAVATITQTNVMTAAHAAAASGGGASGTAAPGGAAGGGGGGVSGTTLGVVGGAAAGGALVAANALGGSEDATPVTTSTYRGSFSLQSVFNQTTTNNGVVIGFCANQAVTITGSVTVRLDDRGTGDIAAEWTQAVSSSGQCPGRAPAFRADGIVSSAADISLTGESTAEYQSTNAGTIRLRRAYRFSGALDGSVINLVVTMSEDETVVAPAGPGIGYSGGHPAASATVTLTRQ